MRHVTASAVIEESNKISEVRKFLCLPSDIITRENFIASGNFDVLIHVDTEKLQNIL